MKGIITTLTLTLLVLLTQPISAQQLPQDISEEHRVKPTIAVTTFENLSAYPENAWVAMSFSEALTTKLQKLYERFHIMERTRIYEVIRERGFDPDALNRMESGQQRGMGSLLGADYLIVGSVSLTGLAEDPETPLLANMRLVDVQTGEIREAQAIKGQMQDIFDLEIQLALAFLKQVGLDITEPEQQDISIKETESLVAERYYSLGNQYFYKGSLEAAETWYGKAVELLEGGYYLQAALRRAEVLKKQKMEAKTESERQQIITKMETRIDQIYQRRTEADEMLFEQAELLTEVGRYVDAIEAYELYLAKVQPWRQVKWRYDLNAFFSISGVRLSVDDENVYIYGGSALVSSAGRQMPSILAVSRESGDVKWEVHRESSEGYGYYSHLESNPSLMRTGDFLYYQRADTLYALDPETGDELWKFQTPYVDEHERVDITNVSSSGMSSLTYVLSSGMSGLILAHGMVYFRHVTGILYALDGNTGELKWSFDTISKGGRWPGPPVISDSAIYISKSGGSSGSLTALNAETGNVLWMAETPIVGADSPIAAPGIVYASTSSGVAAFAAETGKVIWQSDQLANPTLLTLEGKTLYISFNSGRQLVALSASTGEIRWRSGFERLEPVSDKKRMPLERFTEEGSAITEYDNRVVLAGGVLLHRLQDEPEKKQAREAILLRGRSNRICALSAETGEMLWEFAEPDIGPPIVHQGIVYFASGKAFHAVSLDTGEILWEAAELGIATSVSDAGFAESSHLLEARRMMSSAITVVEHAITREYMAQDKTVYLVSSEKGFYAISTETGEIQWKATDLGYIRDYSVDTDGTAYMIASDPRSASALFALSPKLPRHKLRPDKATVLMGLARAKRLMGRYDDAIVAIQEVLTSGPEFASAYSELALYYESKGDWREATQAWDRYLALSTTPGISIPEEIRKRLWESMGLRWYGPGVGQGPGGPIVRDDTVYLAANDGYAYALDVKTGKTKWRSEGGSHGIAELDGQVFIFSRGKKHLVCALDADTGQAKWEFQLPDTGDIMAFGPPVAGDGVVYVPYGFLEQNPIKSQYVQGARLWTHAVRRLYALSAQTGEVIWESGVSSQPPEPEVVEGKTYWTPVDVDSYRRIHPTYMVVQDRIYWCPDMRHIHAISKEDGRELWRFDRGRSAPGSSTLPSPPVITANMVYATAEKSVRLSERKFRYLKQLVAINKETGEIAWELEMPDLDLELTLAATDEVIYVASNRNIYSLSPENGETKWQSRIGLTTFFSRLDLIADNGFVYVHAAGHGVSALDADTGEEIWRFQIHDVDGSFFLNPTPTKYPALALTDQGIYVDAWTDRASRGTEETGRRIVFALSRADGKLTWEHSFSQHPFADLVRSLNATGDALYVCTFTGLYAFDLDKIDEILASGRKLQKIEASSARRDLIVSLMGGKEHPQLDRILIILTRFQGFDAVKATDPAFLELRKMGKSAVPVLIAEWKADFQMKPAAIGARDPTIQQMLVDFGDTSIVPDLEEILIYNSHAAPVLAKLQGEAAIPKLLEVLRVREELGIGGLDAIYSIYSALVTLKAKEAVPILLKRFEAVEEAEKAFVARFLGKLGEPSAIPPLAETLARLWIAPSNDCQWHNENAIL